MLLSIYPRERLGKELKGHPGAVLIDFPVRPWAKVEGGGAVGREKKQVTEGGQAIRILEVSPRWNEFEWCSRPHIGYVTSGRLTLEFAGQERMEVARGRGFWIPEGCAHKARCRRATRIFMVG